MTRAEAADLFRGLAELVEGYPSKGVVVTVDIGVAQTGDAPKKTSTRRKSST